jgi:hypothetical protein
VARWREVVAAQAGFGVPAAFALVGLVFFATRQARDAAEARAALLGEAERRSAAEALAEGEARLQRALATGRVFASEWEPAADEVLRSANCGPILGFDVGHRARLHRSHPSGGSRPLHRRGDGRDAG